MGPGQSRPRQPSSPVPTARTPSGARSRTVTVPVREGEIRGDLVAPPEPIGTVVFAHGSGSGRMSPRNRSVAAELQASGIATVLLDLLTPEEEAVDLQTREFRFDIPRLAGRLVNVIDLAEGWSETVGKPVGLYGASTGGAAALIAAARRPEPVRAVVLRGARSDLAGSDVRRVRAPTLFLVGELDPEIRRINEETYSELTSAKELVIVPRASHLFEEPGTLEQVSLRARDWFFRYLPVRG